MIQSLSSSLVCPEMIVVGILNVDRMRDFTPTHMEAFQFLDLIDTVSPNKTGGGEKFISFVEKELIPHVDSLYPTAPYRIFIGHSAGGLAVMNTLINHPNLFKAYVAIDPIMLWDNQKILKESEKILAKNNYSGIALFLGIANTLPAGMDTIKVKNDKTKITEHIRSLFELRYNLNENKKNQLKFGCKFYPNENHESVPLITIFDAFRFLFGYYHLSFFNNDYKYIENLYDKVSEQFGYKVIPPENIINTRANTHLYYKMYDAALYLYKLNVANYPESYNVYNSIGDYYIATGDKASAINNYQKALSIKEVSAVRQKLEKLQVK
jgi:predicted alpha/beta superfamily hydrolase